MSRHRHTTNMWLTRLSLLFLLLLLDLLVLFTGLQLDLHQRTFNMDLDVIIFVVNLSEFMDEQNSAKHHNHLGHHNAFVERRHLIDNFRTSIDKSYLSICRDND